ncbi:MAG: tyrosine-type recombinase/integrase, partial [Luteitalea sp.]
VALRHQRQRQHEARLRGGDVWHASDFMFTSADGHPIDPSNLRRAFRALLRRAGLPAIRFHDLRHSAASLLIAQGVDVRTVQDILGHSDVRVTLNTYGHVLAATRTDAAQRMDRLLG